MEVLRGIGIDRVVTVVSCRTDRRCLQRTVQLYKPLINVKHPFNIRRFEESFSESVNDHRKRLIEPHNVSHQNILTTPIWIFLVRHVDTFFCNFCSQHAPTILEGNEISYSS